MSDPPRFYLPGSFDAGRVLPPDLRGRSDDARWHVSTVTRKMAFGDVDDLGYVRMHSEIAKRIMAKRTYARVLRELAVSNVYGPIASYCPGRKSKGYRLADQYLDDVPRLVEATDKGLIARIERERERLWQEQFERRLPIHDALERHQRGLTILPEADGIIASFADKSKLCQRILVGHIRDRTPKFTISQTGRCFNWLTGLARPLRPALRLENEPIGGVDIRCAQPALLAALLHSGEGRNVPTYKSTLSVLLSCLCPGRGRGWGRRGRFSGMPGLLLALNGPASPLDSDSDRFEEMVLSGVLYEHLVALCRSHGIHLPDSETPARPWQRRGHESIPQTPRDAVKRYLLRDVIAKRGNYPSDFERAFAAEFPSVFRFIRWINANDHAELIRTLQRLESWLVIEQVAPRLVGRVPILTLHDAIYGRLSDLSTIEGAFNETFETLGLHLNVKVEATAVGNCPPGNH